MCVCILYTCCPNIHSSSDSRSKHVRKSMAGESNNGNQKRTEGCVEVASSVRFDKKVSTGIIGWLSVELHFREIWPSQFIECLFLLLILRFVLYFRQLALGCTQLHLPIAAYT